MEKYPSRQLAGGLSYYLSGVGSAGRKPTAERRQGADLRLHAANAERLERVLCDLDRTKGAAEVRADGYLWIRTRRHGAWHRSVRIRGHESQAAAAWVAAQGDRI